jgi:hypothetical protein
MKNIYEQINHPVKRHQAETYLLFSLISFAISVSGTRLFLELTGYPQIGNSELHIAHVLWGGVLLFVALLVVLIYSNQWAYFWGSIVGGLGVGLFIDEVGKFITQSNDYFYPLAAPIIYAFFLGTVVVYLRVNRTRTRHARTELYVALDLLTEVLNHDLEPSEHAELLERLTWVKNNSDNPEYLRLTEALLPFVDHGDIHLAPERPAFWVRIKKKYLAFEEKTIDTPGFKLFLVGSLLLLGIFSFVDLLIAVSPQELNSVYYELASTGILQGPTAAVWFFIRLILVGSIGLVLMSSALLIAIKKERLGISLAYYGVLMELTATNLLLFYFEQFSTIFLALLQFSILMIIFRYGKVKREAVEIV